MDTQNANYSVQIKSLGLKFGEHKVLEDLNLDIHQGEFLVLLGSSGCGKSTLLNCIAGLLEISEGQLWIQGKNVTWVEPSERGIGMVFQSYALYPQMTVRGNLSFGLKNAKVPAAEIKQRIERAAEILQIQALLDRKPAALSGGQRQRVAIGRALVRDVDVFLFDEPLSNLDAKLRTDLRVEIKRLHQQLKNTMIYVTHDQIEAMTLADRIAIMRGGKIMQLAAPNEIYNRPKNLYVADFIGSPSMNFIEGELQDGVFHSPAFNLNMHAYSFTTPATTGQKVVLGLRPEHILSGTQVTTVAQQIQAQIDLVEPMGSDTLVYAQINGQKLRVRMDGQAQVKAGDTLTLGLQPERASLFDRSHEQRL